MKKLNRHVLFKLALPMAFLASCVKADMVPTPTNTTDEGALFTAPANFNYETIHDVSVNVRLLTNTNDPLSKVLVNIMDKSADDGGRILYTAMTDDNGYINTTFKLPTYLTKVIVDPNYIGVMRNALVRIENNQVQCVLGGADGFSGNVEAQRSIPGPMITGAKEQGLAYYYMGKFDSQGKPSYLYSTDAISSTLLSFVNASLPEQKPVPTFHPDYLKSSAETNLNLTQDGDVYVTFVSEGAGYSNSLAYFTYPTNNPPTKASDIDTLRIIFPNASMPGSGGNLGSGSKVKLGRYSAGTSVGFCIITNGWSGSGVNSGINKFYTLDALNPENALANKRHAVLLYDNTSNLFLVGMEDLHRENGADNDFNDLIFYATSVNANTAISNRAVNPIDRPVDTDGDGVSDVYDQFPNDAKRAYNNYYPSATTWGTVAFEDTWPNTGDYDLNDMIIEYRYNTVNNSQNNTVEIYADYILKAAGATFHNGFGVQFPFAPSSVSSVTGSRNSNTYPLSLNSNGTESGQSKAVIIPFNDFFNIMAPTRTNGTVNTEPGVTFRKPDTIRMKITLASPVTPANLGAAPFNQFMFASDNRGKEIHLPGEKATDRVNTALFNTVKDNTIPGQNRWYKTSANMPFGLGMPAKFDYPIEGKAINKLFLKFEDWAKSGGTAYPDWYINQSGYRASNWFY